MASIDELALSINGNCIAIEEETGRAFRVDIDGVPLTSKEDPDTGESKEIKAQTGTFVRAYKGGPQLRFERVTMRSAGYSTQTILPEQLSPSILEHLVKAAKEVQGVTSQNS